MFLKIIIWVIWDHLEDDQNQLIDLKLLKNIKSVYRRLSDGGFINTADIVPHDDVGDQIVVDEADLNVEMDQDISVTDHDDVKRPSDDVQIRDILRFVHDHSKISNNLKPHGLRNLYIRSLNRKNMRKNTLGGIGQFFDENN